MDQISSVNHFHLIPYAERMAALKVYGYTPQDYQARVHAATGYRVKVLAGGEGSAKTLTAVADYAHEGYAAVFRAAAGQQGADGFAGRIGIIGPDYDKTRTAFDYLYEIWKANGLVHEPTVQRSKNRPYSMVSQTNVEVVTLSGDDVKKALASRGFTIIHGTEIAQLSREAFDRMMGRTQRWGKGVVGVLYLDGRFEDGLEDDWYAEHCRRWAITGAQENVFYQAIAAWENRYMYPEGELTPSLLAERKRLSKRDFAMMYGGVPMPMQSSVWGDYFQQDRHISDHAVYNPDLPVDVYLDPATHRMACVFVQWPSPNVGLVIDELVMENADFHRYYGKFQEKTAGWRFDLEAADIAINSRMQGQQASAELWLAKGHRFQSQYLHIEDGVQVLKTAFSGVYYDLRINRKCEGLIHDLLHERRVNGVVGHLANKGHDDCRKALSYGLRIKKGLGIAQRERPKGGALPSAQMQTRSALLGR